MHAKTSTNAKVALVRMQLYRALVLTASVINAPNAKLHEREEKKSRREQRLVNRPRAKYQRCNTEPSNSWHATIN